MTQLSEKCLQGARDRVAKIILFELPETSEQKAESMAREIVAWIDWDNEALMHKGLTWITEYRLKRMVPGYISQRQKRLFVK